jgi:DNA gyrase/topoisomerase IV subunit A
VSQKGLGFAYEVEALEGIKKNGRRIMKLREGDALASVLPSGKELAMFTRKGLGLCISSKEIPSRPSAAVGVSLMGISHDDHLVGASIPSKEVGAHLLLSSGKEKELKKSEIPTGHRGLKGKKVVSKGEVESVALRVGGKRGEK